MTRPEAAKAMAMLVAAYPVPSWTEETTKLYIVGIEQYDYRAAQEVVERWWKREDVKPTIAQLRREIRLREIEMREKARPALEGPEDTPEALRLAADDMLKLGEAYKGGHFGFKNVFEGLAKKVRARAARLEARR